MFRVLSSGNKFGRGRAPFAPCSDRLWFHRPNTFPAAEIRPAAARYLRTRASFAAAVSSSSSRSGRSRSPSLCSHQLYRCVSSGNALGDACPQLYTSCALVSSRPAGQRPLPKLHVLPCCLSQHVEFPDEWKGIVPPPVPSPATTSANWRAPSSAPCCRFLAKNTTADCTARDYPARPPLAPYSIAPTCPIISLPAPPGRRQPAAAPHSNGNGVHAPQHAPRPQQPLQQQQYGQQHNPYSNPYAAHGPPGGPTPGSYTNQRMQARSDTLDISLGMLPANLARALASAFSRTCSHCLSLSLSLALALSLTFSVAELTAQAWAN